MTAGISIAPGFPGLREIVGARTVDEVLWDNQSRDRFVIEGLVHATTTLVYGLSEAGKSWLMVGMVTALVKGKRWLGQPVTGGPRRCLVLGADAGGEWEYAERLGGGFEDMVMLGTPPPLDPAQWEALAHEAVHEGISVVVVDNLYAWAGAVDMNSNAEVAVPLMCLGLMAKAGIAVVLVHHTNSGGRKPAGVHSIPAYFRHSLEVHRDRVRSHGNDAPEARYWLTRDGGRVLDGGLKKKTEETTSEANTSTSGRKGTRARHEEAIACLVGAPPGLSLRACGRYLSERMPTVGSPDAGFSLVKSLRAKGAWPLSPTPAVGSGAG